MKKGSVLAAVLALILTFAAADYLVVEAPLRADPAAAGYVSLAIPAIISMLGIWFASRERNGWLWLMAGLLGLFLVITVFSIATYIWPTGLALLISATLLQLRKWQHRVPTTVTEL